MNEKEFERLELGDKIQKLGEIETVLDIAEEGAVLIAEREISDGEFSEQRWINASDYEKVNRVIKNERICL